MAVGLTYKERVELYTKQYGEPVTSSKHVLHWKFGEQKTLVLETWDDPLSYLENWKVGRISHREDGPAWIIYKNGVPSDWQFHRSDDNEYYTLSEMLTLYPENRKKLLLWI